MSQKRIISKKEQNENMSFNKIAKILNLPPHQVRNICKQAEVKIKTILILKGYYYYE
jgi:DNA-binding Lrp family transcriptional regulator